jgi:hypothetical protein
MLADTAYEERDPWPVLYLEPGLWECAGSAPGSWRRVDLRGRVPTCACRRQDWRGGRCWHLREVQRQAPAIERALGTAQPRAA